MTMGVCISREITQGDRAHVFAIMNTLARDISGFIRGLQWIRGWSLCRRRSRTVWAPPCFLPRISPHPKKPTTTTTNTSVSCVFGIASMCGSRRANTRFVARNVIRNSQKMNARYVVRWLRGWTATYIDLFPIVTIRHFAFMQSNIAVQSSALVSHIKHKQWDIVSS